MVRLIVFLWSGFSIFIFLHGVIGNNDLRHEEFHVNTLLDGFMCTAELAVKVPSGVVAETGIKCAVKCADHFECIGFYYKADGLQNTCLLCNHLFNSAATANLIEMAGSEYFSRSDCHGWVHGVKNLRIFMDKVNRIEAKTRCEETGGALARIRDESQMKQIQAALTSCASYNTFICYWTDGTLDSTADTWTYSDGTPMPMTAEDFWETGSPDGDGHCTRLKYKSANGKYLWNDYGCSNQYNFICEYD